jgi:nitrite reductase/ring-hydroxylating ferredoxin subunit
MARGYEVGRADELPPGERKLVTVNGVEIGVFNVGGDFVALPNLCVHQWGPLCAGRVTGTLVASAQSNWRREWVREGQVVICPWHSLEFDLMTGQCLAYPRVKLRRYPVVVEDGVVKVIL